jgi:hypothetical protein
MTYTSQVVKGVKFGAQTTVNAQELLVHNGSQGKRAERLHTGLVDDF